MHELSFPFETPNVSRKEKQVPTAVIPVNGWVTQGEGDLLKGYLVLAEGCSQERKFGFLLRDMRHVQFREGIRVRAIFADFRDCQKPGFGSSYTPKQVALIRLLCTTLEHTIRDQIVMRGRVLTWVRGYTREEILGVQLPDYL